MNNKLSRKTVAIAAGTVLLLSSAGAAYAYWTTTGTGTGSATTGTTTEFTVTSDTTGTALSPNGPTQTATFFVANPGSGAQQVNQVVVSIAESDGTAWLPTGGCSAADYQLNDELVGHPATVLFGTVALPAPEVLAPLGKSTNLHVIIQMIDDGTNQNDCKGLTVPLHYAVS